MRNLRLQNFKKNVSSKLYCVNILRVQDYRVNSIDPELPRWELCCLPIQMFSFSHPLDKNILFYKCLRFFYPGPLSQARL